MVGTAALGEGDLLSFPVSRNTWLCDLLWAVMTLSVIVNVKLEMGEFVRDLFSNYRGTFLTRFEEGWRPRKTGGLYSHYCGTSELKRFSPLPCSPMFLPTSNSFLTDEYNLFSVMEWKSLKL